MASEKSPAVLADERTQFAVLLFTDICDSTALKARHGALEYKKVAELHNRLFEELAAEEDITLIKNTGDGYFARSTSVAAVVRFALRFQHGMRVMAWPGFAITTRVGIHAGEVAERWERRLPSRRRKCLARSAIRRGNIAGATWAIWKSPLPGVPLARCGRRKAVRENLQNPGRNSPCADV